MTCAECEQILLEWDNHATGKGWMPGVSVLNLAKLHAERCSGCAGKLLEISRINDDLEQVRTSTHIEAPAEIETNLLLEFRRRRARQVQSVPHNLRWNLRWASGVVLSLVLGFIVYSAFSTRSSSTRAKGVKVEPDTRQSLLLPHSSESFNQPLLQQHPARRDRGGSENPKLVAQVKASKWTHKEAQENPSLPTADEFSLNGGGNVVRVTLPLASLAAMGVPIYPDVPDRRVTADVARDPFGAVVAVRLIETRSSTN
jgi:hypothetical protein